MTEFTYTGTIEFDTLAVSGVYTLSADGAHGGAGAHDTGGSGLEANGDIYLSAGTVLEIVVGGVGGQSETGGGGGGGGGSFIFETFTGTASLTPILIAGGGGGGGSADAYVQSKHPFYGANAQSGTAGGGGAGGSAGAGGAGGQPGSGGLFGGGGGGGYTGGYGAGSATSAAAGGGVSATYFTGGAGDAGGTGGGGIGGFGGGGGGGAFGGGGGGGYGGGGGGGNGSYGGGGGVYFSPDFLDMVRGEPTPTDAGEVSVTPPSQTFYPLGEIQYDTITSSGTYAIAASGAQGGLSPGQHGQHGQSSSDAAGGLGAAVSGDIYLAAGTVLEIIVGRAGGNGDNFDYDAGGGGGGGSFVFETFTGTASLTPILIAGGGGGAGFYEGATYAAGGTSPTGGNGAGPSGGAGGKDGLPGSGAGTIGGGGGGYTGGDLNGAGAVAGTSFAGGLGASYYDANRTLGYNTGGFGGGGGGGFYGGGGGGGYGGGGGGSGSVYDGLPASAYDGGGGGSYDADLIPDTVSATPGAHTGSGLVVLEQINMLCYLHGTRILTPAGQVPVEDLRAGDAVVTRFSGVKPIKWLGRQSYAPQFLARNPEKWPVRIKAGALAPGLPARDLYVSPGHSMLLGDVLVLAGELVNGVTISQIRPDSQVNYVQLDLGDHDCVRAEGAWSETYADAPGLRMQFHNAAEFYALYPDAPPAEALALCAPRPETWAMHEAALMPVVARAAVTPGPLEGWLDSATDWHVTGWARDLAHARLPVLLEVWAGDARLCTVLAHAPRADLGGAGKGNCAFSFVSSVRLRGAVTVRRAVDGAELPWRAEQRRMG